MRNIRRSKGVPGPVAALLDLVMPRGAEEKLALPELRDKWAAAVGPTLAKKTWPDDMEKGVLLVKADSPSSAKALSMRGASVAREASKITGVKVTALKVVVGKASSSPRAGSPGNRRW
jgi:predicted nucleic acid-binding Zn ribbon protein